MRNSSLLSLIAAAFDLPRQSIRAPGWAREELFDVVAKTSADTPKSRIREMLLCLLEDRFRLAAHRETGENSGYALEVASRGAKLPLSAKPAQAAGTEPGQDVDLAAALSRRAKSSMSYAAGLPPGVTHYHYAGLTARQIAILVSGLAEAPVSDMTGLKETYDIDLDIGKPDQPDCSIFAALDRVGLRLKRAQVRTETIVVDRLEKEPTAN